MSNTTLAIRNTSADRVEGNLGITPFTFTVTRAGSTATRSTVSWRVLGTGTNPADAWDFQNQRLPTGRVAFAPGQRTAQIRVNVVGDRSVEPEETFAVSLATPTGARIAQGSATGIIRNDDRSGWAYDWRNATPLPGTRGILRASINVPNSRPGAPPISVTALRVDLKQPGISLTTTGRIAGWRSGVRETMSQTTRGFITSKRNQRVPVVAAINSTYFKLTNTNRSVPTDLLGFAVNNGQLVSPANSAFSATFLVDKITGARIQNLPQHLTPSPSRLSVATAGGINGQGLVLVNGIPRGDNITQDARSGLGLTRDNRFLTMLAINRTLRTRKPTYWGGTIRDIGRILDGFGSYTGMSLDGGGSSALAAWNPTRRTTELLSRPLGGSERFVGSNLGVVYRP